MFMRFIVRSTRTLATTTPANRKIKQLVEVTPSACRELQKLVQSQSPRPAGMKISLKRHGCSGVSFELKYATEPSPGDEQIHLENGVNLFVDPMAVLNVVGTRMDFVQNKLERKFTFDNPNAAGMCGCGESFNFNKESG